MPEGIGYTDPNMFELNTLQAGASNQEQEAPQASSIDLKGELATIQAMNQAPSGGLGKTIGGAAGTGIGAAVGGPAGAAIGGTAGGTIGSVVDYMIEKDAREKADQLRTDALKKEKIRIATKANSDAWLESVAQSKAQGISERQQASNKFDVAKQLRGQFLTELMNKVASTKQNKQASNQSFIQSRSFA